MIYLEASIRVVPGKMNEFMEVFEKVREKKLIQGIEVVNSRTYQPQVQQWCLDYGLTMMGNSDIHGPALYGLGDRARRVMTLVWVKERSLAGLEEGVRAGRTTVWLGSDVYGPERWLRSMYEGAVRVRKVHRRNKNTVWFWVSNGSDVAMELVIL